MPRRIGPVAAADAIAGLEHRAVVAGLAELVGRRQSGHAGAENDDLGSVAGARFERQRLGDAAVPRRPIACIVR